MTSFDISIRAIIRADDKRDRPKRRRIRLPAQSEKILYLIGGSLFIMITINFRKSLRTIVERTAEAA